MKIIKRIFTAVFILGILLMPSFASHAEETAPYKYKITFYSGVQGCFEDGSDTVVHKDLPDGSKVFFNAQSAVKLGEDSKYYVKGVRLSGRDNSEAEMASITVDVNKDEDYVVVYGIKGEQVRYTVKYETEGGKTLAEDDVFYGNVGDKPVVAYKYISGYVPSALAITKTLSENAEENIFTFVYSSASDGTKYMDGETTIIYKDTVTTVVVGGSGGNATGVNAGAEQGTAEGEDTQLSEPEQEGSYEEPQEIIDLDDEKAPLGNIDLDGNDEDSGLGMLGIISLVGIAILALAAILVMILRIRERMKN